MCALRRNDRIDRSAIVFVRERAGKFIGRRVELAGEFAWNNATYVYIVAPADVHT